MCSQITGIGLKSVFSLISQARFSNAQFCEQALSALLDVLQGHAPEELAQEPTDVSNYLLIYLFLADTDRLPGKILPLFIQGGH